MINQRQIYTTANTILKEYLQAGVAPDFRTFIREIIARVRNINFGAPSVSQIPDEDYLVERRSVTDVDKLNRVYDYVRNDISVLSDDMIDIISNLVSDTQYFRTLDKRIKRLVINNYNANGNDNVSITCHDARNIDLDATTAYIDFNAGSAMLNDNDDTISLAIPVRVSATSSFEMEDILPITNLLDDDVNTPFICRIAAPRNVTKVEMSVTFTFSGPVRLSCINLSSITPGDMEIDVSPNDQFIGSFKTILMSDANFTFDEAVASVVTLRIKTDSSVIYGNLDNHIKNTFYIGIENIVFSFRQRENYNTILFDKIENEGKSVVPFRITPTENVPQSTTTLWQYSFDKTNWKTVGDVNEIQEIDSSPFYRSVKMPHVKAGAYTILRDGSHHEIQMAPLDRLFGVSINPVIDVVKYYGTTNAMKRLMVDLNGDLYYFTGYANSPSLTMHRVFNIAGLIGMLWDDDFAGATSDDMTGENTFYSVFLYRGGSFKTVIKKISGTNASYLGTLNSIFHALDRGIDLMDYLIVDGVRHATILREKLIPIVLPGLVAPGEEFEIVCLCTDKSGEISGRADSTFAANNNASFVYNGTTVVAPFENGIARARFTSAGISVAAAVSHTLPSKTDGENDKLSASVMVNVTTEPYVIDMKPFPPARSAVSYLIGNNFQANDQLTVGYMPVAKLTNNKCMFLYNAPGMIPGERYGIYNNIQFFSLLNLDDFIPDDTTSYEVRLRRGFQNWKIMSYHYEIPSGSSAGRYPYSLNDFYSPRGNDKHITNIKYRFSDVDESNIVFPFYEYPRVMHKQSGFEDIVLHRFTMWVYVNVPSDSKYNTMMKNLRLFVDSPIFRFSNKYNIFINGKEVNLKEFSTTDSNYSDIYVDKNATGATGWYVQPNFTLGWNSIDVITENITPRIDKIRKNENSPPMEIVAEPSFLLFNTDNVTYVDNPDIVHNSYYNVSTMDAIDYHGPIDLQRIRMYFGNDVLLDLANGTNTTGIFGSLEPAGLVSIYAEPECMEQVSRHTFFFKTPRIQQNRFAIVDDTIVLNTLPTAHYTIELFDTSAEKYPRTMYLLCHMANSASRPTLTPQVHGVKIDMRKYK